MLKKIMLILIIAILLLQWQYHASANDCSSGLGLTNLSCAGSPDDFTISDTLRPANAPLTVYNRRAISALLSLHGDSMWIGYSAGGWAIPGGFGSPHMAGEAWITLDYSDGSQQWIWIVRDDLSPQVEYIWLFPYLFNKCDSNGQHCGQHPSGQFIVPRSQLHAVYCQIGAYGLCEETQ